VIRRLVQDVQVAVQATSRAIKGRDDALEFVMNGSNADRGGDWVDHSGAELERFRLNPVMPWAHDYRGLPLGHWEDVRHERRRGLVGVGVFSAAPVYPFAATVLELYRRTILRACSIGFNGLEWRWAPERGDGARDFLKYELLECSAVMIGQHQDALATAKQAGMDLSPIFERAEAERQKVGRCSWLPRQYQHELEEARASVCYPRAPSEEEAALLRKREAAAEAEVITRLVMERLTPVVDQYFGETARPAEDPEAAAARQLLAEFHAEEAAQAAAQRAERAGMARALRELCAEAEAEAAVTREREARWRQWRR
jgi:hypothetical protein